jgi:HAD superfamily hydrolase (TIGR01509 family)
MRHILFDNDGTLVDTEIIAVRAMLGALRTSGFEMSERDYCARFPGLLETDILEILKNEYGAQATHEHLEMSRQRFHALFATELRPITGMPDIFRQLKVPKSIVSNAGLPHIERCLRGVDLLEYLDGQMFSAQQVAQPKPQPDVYLLALRQLGLHPSETLAVEDSPTGVRAAKAAGLAVIGFLGAAHVHDDHGEHLKAAGADFIAEDARALGMYLQEKKVL